MYDGLPARLPQPDQIWASTAGIQAAYGAVDPLLDADRSSSFVQHANDDNLVVIALGDHQPATVVSGEGASHDVPVSIIAHDPAVLERIAPWKWQDGLLPASERTGVADGFLPRPIPCCVRPADRNDRRRALSEPANIRPIAVHGLCFRRRSRDAA